MFGELGRFSAHSIGSLILAAAFVNCASATPADGMGRTFVEAVLVAEGANPDGLRESLVRYDEFSRRLMDDLRRFDKAAPSIRAAALLVSVHHRVLVGTPDAEFGSVAAALEVGRFNCLSAAILYRAWAANADIETRFISAGPHIWLELAGDSSSLDAAATGRKLCPTIFIEPTLAGGVGKLIRSTETLLQSSAVRRLTAREALALVYYNRGARLARDEHWEEAISANFSALRLDGKLTDARANLAAAANNWAVALAREGQPDRAARLLRLAVEIFPDEPASKANLRVVAGAIEAP